ncbi:MAG: hypothetical protein II059_02195 [Clostridia bacterium]|nr:hypothetical protein [Clostridia bacterium]
MLYRETHPAGHKEKRLSDILREQRFVVIGGDAGGKAAVGRFHIPVPVVAADDFCVVDRFHHKSFPAHSAFQIISDNSFSGGKKAAECDLDGSMTAFCILNGGNG